MAFDAAITEKSADLIVLERARDHILQHGWLQGSLGSDGGPVCIMGALCAADGWAKGDIIAQERVRRTTLLGFEARYMDAHKAVAWNDAPGRTQAEVLARFDTAIARLAGETQ